MKIKIEYSNGQKYEANISEKAIEDAAACILDSVHNTVKGESCGSMEQGFKSLLYSNSFERGRSFGRSGAGDVQTMEGRQR